MFVLNPYGLPGVCFLLVAWMMAALVHFAAPRRPLNRRLSAAFLFESIFPGVGGGLMYLAASPTDAFAFQIVAFAGLPFAFAAYLSFLALLDTPLTRWLRPVAVRIALFAIAAVVSAWVIARPSDLVVDMVRLPTGDFEIVPTPAALLLAASTGPVYLFAFAAAMHAWRRAPVGSMTRKKAGWFALAFGVKDSLVATFFLAVLVLRDPVALHALSVGVNAAGVSALFLLAYAILREHVLDIDLRLRWTVSKTTVTSAFVATFFVASELAQQFLGDTVGSAYVGTVATGALLFALAPLQRLADRFAAAAVPRTRDEEAYRETRRLEVYRAAYENAVEDGPVTEKERTMLATLASELGLSPRAVLDLERAASGASAAPSTQV